MRYVLPVAALLALAAIFALGAFSRPRQAPPEPDDSTITPAYTFAEMRAIARLSDQLDEDRSRMHRFSDALAAIRAELWRREIGAFAAADRVLDVARELSPPFVAALAACKPGLSDREAALASVLVTMRSDLEAGCAPPEASAAVWEEILCELCASGEVGPGLVRELSATGPTRWFR